jgi:alkaline phosphatase
MKNRVFILLLIYIITQILSAKPKNIIVCIGDGMGFNHVKVSDYYEFGEEGNQIYEQFPIKLAMSTCSTGNGSYDPSRAWNNFRYLKSGYTDSAAAATAMATGSKTKNGMLGIDASGNNVSNVTETAIKLKKSTGFVTTVPYSHATPAGFSIHAKSRDDYHHISQDIVLDSNLSVAFGGGNPDARDHNNFHYIGPEDFWKWLPRNDTSYKDKSVQDIDGDKIPDPWTFISDRKDFLKYAIGDTPKRILGVYKSAKYGQETRVGDAKALPFEVPFDESLPTLLEMTAVALNVLDNNPEGFFLLVEGGAIDSAAHENESGRLVEEMLSFNETVRMINTWVEENSNWDETLLIVTADHETGCIWGPDADDKESFRPILNNGKGILPGFQFYSDGHTNSLVPFFAKGVDSDLFTSEADENDPVRGAYLDNAEMGKVLNNLWMN